MWEEHIGSQLPHPSHRMGRMGHPIEERRGMSPADWIVKGE
jgi:hypothetical protein